MSGGAYQAISAALRGEVVFCKFLAANDTGQTGGHQSGIFIPKNAYPILFPTPGVKGENKDAWAVIEWPDGSTKDVRFIYYGQKTRNEYRITNFGRGFPYLRPEYTGALFVLIKCAQGHYRGFFLDTDDDINDFLAAFSLSPADTNALIGANQVSCPIRERVEMENFIKGLSTDFPSSEEMSRAAREIQDIVYDHREHILTNPDGKLLEWTAIEYRLFRAIENARYGHMVARGFPDMDAFVATANVVLNRRKSRAGKSLEHHLAALFDGNGLAYRGQAVTEGNKKPDFIFPSIEAYRDSSFPVERLIMLAAKTTCKDRWRQVLNEADRLRGRPKFLCTLQQGISSAQMDEMEAEKVILVVPEPYINTYPSDRRDRLWTINKFISHVKKIEGMC